MHVLSHDDAGLVTAILASLDMEATAVQFLTAGATSRVWRAQTRTGAVVIRVGDPAPGKVARFEAEVGVRQRLYRVDGQVAEPLAAGRWSPAMPGHGADVAWCVDRFIVGGTAPRGAIPDQVCRDLGELLSRLHAVPVVGHGLLEDRRDGLIGQAPDPVAGLLTRLQDPWPFSPFPLQRHPIATAAPDLVGRLAPLENGLRAVVVGRARCLNHTDLHEKQILIAGGRLVGLLDFGDAAIGPPAWDVASFAYFHGWRLARVLLSGYTPDEWLRRRLLKEARSFAILIALHHASRSVSLQRPQRMRDAIQFLRLTLASAAPGRNRIRRARRRRVGLGRSRSSSRASLAPNPG